MRQGVTSESQLAWWRFSVHYFFLPDSVLVTPTPAARRLTAAPRNKVDSRLYNISSIYTAQTWRAFHWSLREWSWWSRWHSTCPSGIFLRFLLHISQQNWYWRVTSRPRASQYYSNPIFPSLPGGFVNTFDRHFRKLRCFITCFLIKHLIWKQISKINKQRSW